MLDNKLTENIIEWLDKDEYTDDDLMNGARWLLQLNNNLALYNTIIRRPTKYVEKMRYEMKKFLPARLDGMTMTDVVKMSDELVPQIKEHIEEEDSEEPTKGKRADHDELPKDIREIWEDILILWRKIREKYNLLLEIKHPCDRYEHLKLMKEAWYKYKELMAKYDTYQNDGHATHEDESSESSAVDIDDLKAVNAARTYLSKNIDAVIEMVESGDEKADELKQKIQERVDLLCSFNQELSKKTVAKLAILGITFS